MFHPRCGPLTPALALREKFQRENNGGAGDSCLCPRDQYHTPLRRLSVLALMWYVPRRSPRNDGGLGVLFLPGAGCHLVYHWPVDGRQAPLRQSPQIRDLPRLSEGKRRATLSGSPWPGSVA